MWVVGRRLGLGGGRAGGTSSTSMASIGPHHARAESSQQVYTSICRTPTCGRHQAGIKSGQKLSSLCDVMCCYAVMYTLRPVSAAVCGVWCVSVRGAAGSGCGGPARVWCVGPVAWSVEVRVTRVYNLYTTINTTAATAKPSRTRSTDFRSCECRVSRPSHAQCLRGAAHGAVRTPPLLPWFCPETSVTTAVHKGAPPSTRPSLWHGPVDRGLPLLDQVGVGLAEDLHGWVDA